MFGVRAEEPLIAVTAADDETCALELRQLILNRVHREETQTCQLAPIQFLAVISKQQPQHFCPNDREQPVQEAFSAPCRSGHLDGFKPSSVIRNLGAGGAEMSFVERSGSC